MNGLKKYRPIIFIFIFFAVSSCSVKPSFNDDNIIPELKQRLLDEFDIDALVKKEKTTIAICFTIPKLFSSNQKTMPVAIDQLQNVMLCLRRILLSSSCDIRFFQINIRGKNAGVEISLIRYVHDLKILLLSGISFNDYAKRMLYRNAANFDFLGKNKLNQFFNDLGKKKPEKIIASHFTASINKTNISPGFITWLWESLMKRNIQHDIMEIRVKNVDDHTYYFYLKVKETFEQKHGFKNFAFSNHSNDIKEYLIEMQSINFYSASISRLLIINDTDETDRECQKIIDQYGDYKTWNESDFHAVTLTLKDFLAEQIASRIQMKLNKKESESKNPLSAITAIKGLFEEDFFKFLFIYRDNQDIVKSEDTDLAIEITKQICKLYRFSGYTAIKTGTLKGQLTSYPVSK